MNDANHNYSVGLVTRPQEVYIFDQQNVRNFIIPKLVDLLNSPHEAVNIGQVIA